MWGSTALLANLEMRAGLPGVEQPGHVRLQRWSRRLHELDSEVTWFYSRSYAADPIGTSRTLLAWRDTLVDAGWDGDEIPDGGERLRTLHDLERVGEAPAGRPDRLRAIETEIRNRRLRPFDAIQLAEPIDDWPGRWRRLFALLEEAGTPVRSVEPQFAPSNTEVEGVLDRLIAEEAAVLLRAGKAFERVQVKRLMIRAVTALSELLASSGFVMEAVESACSVRWGSRQLDGRLDLLLRDKSGADFVLDLKWGTARYRKMLMAGTATQLAIYAAARQLETGAPHLPDAAYFSLSRGELLATDVRLFRGVRAVHGPDLASTWQRLDRTVDLEPGDICVLVAKNAEAEALAAALATRRMNAGIARAGVPGGSRRAGRANFATGRRVISREHAVLARHEHRQPFAPGAPTNRRRHVEESVSTSGSSRTTTTIATSNASPANPRRRDSCGARFESLAPMTLPSVAMSVNRNTTGQSRLAWPR